MKFTIKHIWAPILAVAAVLASCSEWTEAENKDFLPQIKQNAPAALAALREFKAGTHMVTMMHVKGSSTAPNRQNQHLTAMPDSVDYFLMSDAPGLHPALAAEIAEVRETKATRTLNIVDYMTIYNAWMALKDAAADTEHESDYADEKFADYCRTETEKHLDACEAYGFDGLVVSYLGGVVNSTRKPFVEPFIETIEKWHKAHPKKLLFFRGYPSYIAGRIDNLTLLDDSAYIIVLTDKAAATMAISRQVRDELISGVPTDRLILEASVPSIADGGDDAQVGATLQVAAQWVMDPSTATTAKCDKRGLAASNAQDDYFNTPIYKRVREAIAIMNPEPEK